VRGLIVGPTRADQELRPQLQQQAAMLGLLPDGIEFRGSTADMPAIYREAAVCVLTSDHEGTPNVLLEAMASGLPVVATNVGGVPEIVRNGETGFLFAPGDVKAQVSAIVRLVCDHGLRSEVGLRARASVEANHSAACLPVHLDGLYDFARSKTGARGKSGSAADLPTESRLSGSLDPAAAALPNSRRIYEYRR